jgi:alpha/beta superfamily hydrolase
MRIPVVPSAVRRQLNGAEGPLCSQAVPQAPGCFSRWPLYSVLVHASIRSFSLPGPAGPLEALLNAGVSEATHAAVVTHPHPLYGGTLHNKVVFHAMKALNALGFPVLRFNFRGTGLSAGEHDHGIGEVDDVHAVLDWLDREFQLPMIFAGFSFGAAVGLRAACPDPRAQAVIALGTPVSPIDNRSYDYDFLRTCSKPKLFVSGSRDQFASKAKLEALVSELPDPKKLVIIDAADHFFEGRLREMREVVESWTRDMVGA